MIKLNVRLGSLKRDVLTQAELESLPELVRIANAAIAELQEATPVDTGFAASNWSYRVQGKTIILENDTAYIELLNKGSSQQAPAFFIESIVLKYGTPSGPIVTYT